MGGAASAEKEAATTSARYERTFTDFTEANEGNEGQLNQGAAFAMNTIFVASVNNVAGGDRVH